MQLKIFKIKVNPDRCDFERRKVHWKSRNRLNDITYTVQCTRFTIFYGEWYTDVYSSDSSPMKVAYISFPMDIYVKVKNFKTDRKCESDWVSMNDPNSSVIWWRACLPWKHWIRTTEFTSYCLPIKMMYCSGIPTLLGVLPTRTIRKVLELGQTGDMLPKMSWPGWITDWKPEPHEIQTLSRSNQDALRC